MGAEFSRQDKNKARIDRLKEGGLRVGAIIEVDHIVPKYMGGNGDTDNMDGVTLSEHAVKHFLGAAYPELEQIPRAEFYSFLQVAQRMNLDDFSEFLGEVKPLIDDLVERTKDKHRRKKSR